MMSLSLHDIKKISVELRLFKDFKIMQYQFEDSTGSTFFVEVFHREDVEIVELPPKDYRS